MTASGLRYDRYWPGEWMMRIGSSDAPQILFLPPLFEEMNRTRALIAGVMRGLASAGFGCALPDLPGTGESERALETVAWEDWRDAVASAASRIGPAPLTATVAIRGGALLEPDAGASCRWRFAPVPGASLVRDLVRAGLASGGGTAGYDPSPKLVDSLQNALPAPKGGVRTLRLVSDPGDADVKLEGPSLWRRSEPQTSSELAALIVEDINQWVRQCAAS